MHELSCDVIVVGSGLAGTTAALAAAEAGASVTLISLGPLFSGSSFYPGTWGLGCVGPENEADVEEFVQTIYEVGQQIPDLKLVRILVGEIPHAFSRLACEGVALKQPEHADEQEFIPCFDHKHRTWRGIERAPYEHAITELLREHNVRILPGLEALELMTSPAKAAPNTDTVTALDAAAATTHPAVCGILCFDHNEESPTAGELVYISAKSVVLATGGSGGLFARRLTGEDVIASAQGMAAGAGAHLINTEFIQIMPGLVGRGEGIVFNEKIFRHVELLNPDGTPALLANEAQAILEARSGHGPFTTMRISREVDFAMARAGEAGLRVRSTPPASNASTHTSGAAPAPASATTSADPNLPEFVRVYFAWLKEQAGIEPTDEMRIVPYAHAANGGIAIDSHGFTGVPGLYACGEATGGMHGADRIGGLASANALVFGERAGRAAAAHAAVAPDTSAEPDAPNAPFAPSREPRLGISAACAQELTALMQHTMSENCLVIRSHASLAEAARTLTNCAAELDALATPTTDTAAYARAARLRHQLAHAQAIVEAATQRTHSLGAHCYTE